MVLYRRLWILQGNRGVIFIYPLDKYNYLCYTLVRSKRRLIKLDFVDKIIAFENGEMSFEDTVKWFQEMINDGSVWTLQGFYGRTAQQLIDEGYCTRP